jgi:hypothetical protein
MEGTKDHDFLIHLSPMKSRPSTFNFAHVKKFLRARSFNPEPLTFSTPLAIYLNHPEKSVIKTGLNFWSLLLYGARSRVIQGAIR